MIFPSLRRQRPAADNPGHGAGQAGSGAEVSIGGRSVISFAGDDWLGLGKHPAVIAAGCQAFAHHGLRPADEALVRDLEERAAGFFGKEATVLLDSSSAATALLMKMAGKVAAIFVDERAPARMKGVAHVAGVPVHTFRSCDPEDLHARISSLLPAKGLPLVMSDGIMPATGIVPPLDAYLRVLAAHAPAVLVVEDRLGPWALGPNGRGALEELGLDEHANRPSAGSGVAVFASSGLSFTGSLICGARDFVGQAREMLAGEARPQPAAVIAAAAKALEIAATELQPARAALLANSARLRQGMSQLGLELPAARAPFFGLQIGTAANMARIHRELLAAGLLVPVVPAPGEGEVLRFAITRSHTHAMVDALLHALCVIL
jgi:8-amino-7-oxononanoate synthase